MYIRLMNTRCFSQKLIKAILFILLCSSMTASWSAWLSPIDENTSAVTDGQYGYQWEDRDIAARSKANNVAIDGLGNIYTAGYRDSGADTNTDIVLTKRSPDGVVLWESQLDCPGLVATTNCSDRAVAIVVDSANDDLFVLAASDRGVDVNGVNTDQDLIVLKYNAVNNQPVWVSDRYDNSFSEDYPAALALAPAGGLYIAGSSQNANISSHDVVTAMVDASGTLVWDQRYEYLADADDKAVNLQVDAAGNVFVLANTAGGSGGAICDAVNHAVLVKYDVSGVEQWAVDDGHCSNARANAMAIDAAGDIYITGSIIGSNAVAGGNRDVLIMAFNNSDGSVKADASPLPISGHDIGGTITVSAGTVYVGALTGGLTDYDLIVLKFNAGLGYLGQSARLDSGTDDGPGPGWINSENDKPGPASIHVDSLGRIYLVAAVGGVAAHNIGLYILDISLALVDSVVKPYTGDALVSHVAFSPDIHGKPIVYVAGHEYQPNTGDDYAFALVLREMHPDLQISSVVSQTLWPWGGQVNIQATIANARDVTTGSLSDVDGFTITYSVVAANGAVTTLGSNQIAGLASNATTTDSFNYIVSNVLTEGADFTLRAEVDPLDLVIEGDDTNNITTGTVVTAINPPDLIISAASFSSASVAAAANIDVLYTIQNLRATAIASTFDVSFWLSGDNIVGNADDINLVGIDQISSLGGNSSLNRQVTVTVPNNTLPGNYRLIVIADPTPAPNGAILESDESNNSYIDASATLAVLAIPDLFITSVSGALGAVANGTMTVSDVVSTDPSGGNVSAGVVVAYFLSTDAVITNADTRLIGERVLATGIIAGQSNSGGTTVTIPSGITPGLYYLGAIVDDVGAVAESNETNNSGVATNTRSIGPATNGLPDLRVTDIVAPTSASYDISFNVTPQIENVLPYAATQPFSVGVYLSPDSQITATDIRLGGYTINNTSAATWTDQTTLPITIPSVSTQPITWAKIARATVGTNNLLQANASVGIDGGASSAQTFSSNGGIEMTVIENNIDRFFGLSASDPNYLFTSIDYCVYLRSNGTLFIYEQGVGKSIPVTTYATNDVIRIERTGSVVKYLKNGAVFYTSTTPSSGPLRADVTFRAIFSANATIANGTMFSSINSGNYYLGAIADDTNLIPELSETNNTGVLNGVGGPVQTVLAVVNGGDRSGGGVTSLLELCMLLFGVIGLIFMRDRYARYSIAFR